MWEGPNGKVGMKGYTTLTLRIGPRFNGIYASYLKHS